MGILSISITSKNRDNPYWIKIEDWKEVGLKKESWARIDRIVKLNEWDIDSKLGDLSEKDLKKIFQLSAEIISEKYHEFSLIAVKNSDNKYLLEYDERWKCWLFPYVRSSDSNKENVDNYIIKILGQDIETSYNYHG